jgi:hypothetical protein
MKNLVSRVISQVNSLLQGLQVKRVLAAVLVGFLLLSTNIDPRNSTKAITKEINSEIHQGDSQRPKTTGEWEAEAHQTSGKPGERLQNIVEETGEALKDWGSLYPDTAERSAEQAGRNLSK